jgi:hypothetical protein
VQKSKDTLLLKIHSYLFGSDAEKENLVFHKDEQEVVMRYRAAFTKWLAEPALRDHEMISYLKVSFGISDTQAYRDLSRIKSLIGNLQNAGKEFQRHRATEMILKGYALAAEADSHLEVKQAMAMIRAGEALVRVHKLDKEEMERIPWEDIIPLDLEPTTDISVIGRRRIDNIGELQQKIRSKYGGTPTDIPYTEIRDDE